mgnify:FL=1
MSTSSEEQLLSYINQVTYYEQYIKEHPDYIFSGIYADEGISGTGLKKRDAFSQMMTDCEAGKIDMIITKSVSRFGRNTVDCLKSIRKLKEYGVNVLFEKEAIETMKAEGELLLTIMMALSQNESKVQSDNVKWGLRRRYEQGSVKSIPSGKFLGYDKDQAGDLIINEEQAKIVKRIYKEFLMGYGYCNIANRLTKEGVRTEQNKNKWSWSVIRKILANEKYKGDTLCQKTYNADYLTKRRAKNKGELPQPYFHNTHPAIIDRSQWKCVQFELARQKKFTGDHYTSNCHKNNERLPMTSKMTCKHCGCTFVRREYFKKELQHQRYWCCGSFYKKGWERKRDNVNLSDDRPTSLFVEAWNYLIEYQHDIDLEAKDDESVLEKYRKEQLILLMQKYGRITEFDYPLMLQTLDHIEIANDGIATAIFLAGIQVKIDI